MSDIPVFTKENDILGYLDSAQIGPREFLNHESFRLFTRPPLQLAAARMQFADTELTISYVVFIWQTMSSQRAEDDIHADRGRHVAFVLQVPDLREHALLGKIKGFKWFAEQHGEQWRTAEPRR